MIIQKNVLILIGIISLAYVAIFLLAPKDVADYTVVDTIYWRETDKGLLLKTAYDYNDKESILSFPKIIGEWKSFDYKYPEFVYTKLNADILMSRGYTKNNKSVVWMDIINSKTGESFHKQKICVEGAGWTVDNESIAEFDTMYSSEKLYANRLDISKGDKKQIMVYWFMFKKFGNKDEVTMIRLSSPVRNNDIEKTFNLLKEFVERRLFFEMYKGKKEETTSAEYLIDKYKNKGKVGIMLSVLIPLGIILIGITKRD